nr:GNAT family N-acetyltransferase [Candidatus Sigynarchaeota archaeon]
MEDEKIKIRDYNAQDEQYVTTLMQALCKTFKVEFDEERWRKSLEQKIAKSDFTRMFVADKDGQAMGMLVADIRSAEERTGHITNLIVAPDYRNIGVGEKLINAATDFFCDNHVLVVKVNLRAGTDSATKLFAKLGFVEYAVQFRKDL